MCDTDCNYVQVDVDASIDSASIDNAETPNTSKKDVILKKGSIIQTNDKTLGFVKVDFIIPQNETDITAIINLIKGKNTESQNVESQEPQNKLDIILMNSDPEETKTIDYVSDISCVFNQPITLLELAQETLKFFTFRRKDRLLKKISPYDNEEFFYGFTTSLGLYHSDFYNYDCVFNVPRLRDLPSSLYYQAGDYSDPLFAFGNIDLSDCYNKKEYGAVGDLMCGYASDHEKGPRFVRWFYCGQAFYNLWLLIMFGPQYYIFKGADKKEIIDRLYDDNLSNPHLYQAYAHVIYYNEPIPESYQLGNLGDLISDNLLRSITF